ncbi:DUF2977 domain-containing protein [Staphylococcus warneri]|uniref:DUF2977 domain-containing protein n=1 Tax=Staphylococcus TaxID=1279 RepID=UPI0006407CE9|nr:MULTISPECIES: DUF2977 domain-containing protein [Staphylococcus]MCG7307101.1 DUF2977 domain-containing protein [Staphylococcus warneri]MCM3482240.1 DUF2977 domain-containing protein [Staphylococcus warneri]MCT1632250.1 DUF2977 domain-containing protein [Staphylococcus warneri]MCT2348273.1 DUF2977 domain-containing protein [Staphylococcus warneri]MCV7476653.1 DUF2977 domain-containing protein [Staphylococcus warneri]
MRILINENNEIIGYAKVGSLNNDFEVEDSIVPQNFEQLYKPKYFLYQPNEIVMNPHYQNESVASNQTTNSTSNLSNDDSLKLMIASLQKQSVQNAMKILKIQKENETLKNKLSDLQKGLEVT